MTAAQSASTPLSMYSAASMPCAARSREAPMLSMLPMRASSSPATRCQSISDAVVCSRRGALPDLPLWLARLWLALPIEVRSKFGRTRSDSLSTSTKMDTATMPAAQTLQSLASWYISTVCNGMVRPILSLPPAARRLAAQQRDSERRRAKGTASRDCSARRAAHPWRCAACRSALKNRLKDVASQEMSWQRKLCRDQRGPP